VEPKLRIDPDAKTYKRQEQTTEYSHDPGLVALPVASRASAHRLIRLHGGIGKRRVKWRMDREGAPPYIPAARNLSDGDVLLSSTVTPSLPRPNPTVNGFDWSVEGEYVFVQARPRLAGRHTFPAGNHAFIVQPQAKFAAKKVESVLTGVYSDPNIAAEDKIDSVMNFAATYATIGPDGTIEWPFTILPAEASSTHIIGG
jgi:hypothetical protein